VKKALHVAPEIDWAVCSNNNSFSYNSNIPDERTVIYPGLLKAGLNVLVYNGEADLCVPYTDNEWWTRTMNLNVSKEWRAWEYDGDQGATVGGYVISYGKNFQFATVRGAGHMVPETRGQASLKMMENMVFGKGNF
jgi:carboxypeptidase C (cathepsin A)